MKAGWRTRNFLRYKSWRRLKRKYGEDAFEIHSSNKDCFFKKKAIKKINYEELWEKQQLENKKQQEILDRKYYNDLIRKRKLYQKQAITSRYEKGTLVTKYRLTPEVVDILCFCSKNPKPMLSGLPKIAAYRQFWFVTITPYGKEIEPNVPESAQVIETVRQLSGIVGQKAVAWRYDPIFLSEKYTAEYHVAQFEKMAAALQGKIAFCVISFIDLYEKTRRNFPQVRAVTKEEQEFLIKQFAEIGRRYRMPVRTCCENPELGKYGVETSGCMTQEVLERGTGCLLSVPTKKKAPRAECNCLLGADIGAYNTCPHGCIYCYANYDKQTVLQNFRHHDPNSPFLIGTGHPEDQIRDAVQESWIDGQLRLF